VIRRAAEIEPTLTVEQITDELGAALVATGLDAFPNGLPASWPRDAVTRIAEESCSMEFGRICERIVVAADGSDISMRSLKLLAPELDDLLHRASPIKSTHQRLRPLSQYEPKPVEWLWRNRFPKGELSIIAGEPGVGKSFLVCDLIARITTGCAFADNIGGEAVEPGSVIYLAAEDSIEYTVAPRIQDARGDASRVLVMAEPMTMPKNVEDIADALAVMDNPRLIVLDPINAFVETGTDSNTDTEVRGFLQPLIRLAHEYGIAVICVCHLNKGGAGNVINRVLGSIGYVGSARCVWYVARDPNDKHRNLLLHAKSNVGPMSHGLAYTIDGGGQAMTAMLSWETNPVEMFADDLGSADDTSTSVEQFLRDALRDGPVEYVVLEMLADRAGIKPQQIKRLMNPMGIKTEKVDGRRVWSLVDATANVNGIPA